MLEYGYLIPSPMTALSRQYAFSKQLAVNRHRDERNWSPFRHVAYLLVSFIDPSQGLLTASVTNQ